jgi:acyl-CoA synthetase (AMP-forming)/AMP-acid ligase II
VTHPTFGEDIRLHALIEATDELTRPGAPFEVVTEKVLGQDVEVFVRRPYTLADVLDAAAARGDAECYVFSDGRRVTFSDLGKRATAVAELLHDRYGLVPGDRLAIAAANCPEWIAAFWAATCSGLVVVAMNGWWTGSEMRNAVDLAEPSLVLLDEKRRNRLGDSKFPTAVIGPEWDACSSDDHLAVPPEMGEDDPSLLIFTSGTTGRPKAAVWSHRSVIGYLMLQSFMAARSAAMAAKAGRGAIGQSVPPVRLAPYPLFHVSGLSMMGGSVMNGVKSVWPLGRFEPSAVIRLTKEEGITAWGGGTAHVVRLLESPELDSLPDRQLVSVTVAGSATTPDIIRRVEQRFPHLKGTVSTGYGSTETGGLATWAPNWMLAAAPDCVGPVLPTVSVRVTGDDGEVLSDGQEGNIEIRSAYTMLGHWGHPEADRDTIQPGRWVRSGDFGRLEQGVLFVASRRRDLIIRGGENVYPFEIENRFCEHPGVLEAAAFGVDDPIYGQKVKAVAVVRPGAGVDAEKIRSFCAEALAYYKVPDIIELTTSPLPRNASGKVMKHVLAGEAQSGFSADEE